MGAKRVYGIDLGTTYSCICVVDESGRPQVIQNAEGDFTTPSVVFFEPSGNVVVGKYAKNSSRLSPDRAVDRMKRYMGDKDFSREVDGRQYRPEELSSFVLRKLAGDAAQSGDPVEDVVITCPAYFGAAQRTATENAGRLAGLNVLYVLSEPTAAAICYGVDKTETDQTVLVFDFGGGTFDVTLIAITQGSIRVVCTDGDDSLGGVDIDSRIVSYLAEQFIKQCPAAGDPQDDCQSLQNLAIAAEEVKKRLSSLEKTAENISHGGVMARVEFTREELESLIADLIERTITTTKRALDQGAERGHAHVDHVLLVGGSSRMPCVARRLKEALGLETQMFEPDLAVAKGAALMGLKIRAGELIDRALLDMGVSPEAIESGRVDPAVRKDAERKVATKFGLPAVVVGQATGRTIMNVCSKGVGVRVVAGPDRTEKIAFLVHANTPVPTKADERFGTVEANQRSVSVQVYEQAGQVESEVIEDNKLLAKGEITDLPPNLPSGSPIDVTYELDVSGKLLVGAVEPESGKGLHLEVMVEGAMTEAEVEKSTAELLKRQVQ
jgi:molecular chaperone DnaK (HSP70)